jgi:tetratricopeptide (TPR) repeat protein
MNVNNDFKLIIIFLIFILILCAPGPARIKTYAAASEFLDRINAPLSCARVKKRIIAALELYIVDNRLPSSAKVSVRDIVSSKYLRYELVCPEGGRYSFTPEMSIECSKCDKVVKSESESDGGTVEVAAAAPKADATLETKINKYLDIDDLEFLNNPQKSAAVEVKTVETEIAKVNIAGGGAVNAGNFKNVPGAQEDEAWGGGEEDDTRETAAGEEQISIKENSNIGKGARDFHNEAIEHARRGEVDNAIEKFKKAIELVPDSFTYHYNYGLFLAKIESYDLAYIEFQRATRLDPQNVKVKTMIEKLKKAISAN